MRTVRCLNCFVPDMPGNIGCEECKGEGTIEIGDELCAEEIEIMEMERIKAETIKPYYERREAAIARYLARFEGAGLLFQNPIHGIVFRVAPNEWEHIKVNPWTIERSRLAEERAGTISVKDVEAAGLKFHVPDKIWGQEERAAKKAEEEARKNVSK